VVVVPLPSGDIKGVGESRLHVEVEAQPPRRPLEGDTTSPG